MVLYIMTKTTIYLAKIIKPNDYSTDTTIELEAFTTLEKAMAFMTEKGMVELSYGWVADVAAYRPDSDMEGTIEALKVN